MEESAGVDTEYCYLLVTYQIIFRHRHSLCRELLRHGDDIDGRRELPRSQDILQDVVAEIERAGGLPLGHILKELVQVLPVALRFIRNAKYHVLAQTTASPSPH